MCQNKSVKETKKMCDFFSIYLLLYIYTVQFPKKDLLLTKKNLWVKKLQKKYTYSCWFLRQKLTSMYSHPTKKDEDKKADLLLLDWNMLP